MHLDTSRDVTPRARLGTAVGVPGMQEVLLEPRNGPVQVLSGRPPGKAAHGGRESFFFGRGNILGRRFKRGTFVQIATCP